MEPRGRTPDLNHLIHQRSCVLRLDRIRGPVDRLTERVGKLVRDFVSAGLDEWCYGDEGATGRGVE
jgi:hypothetical protein